MISPAYQYYISTYGRRESCRYDTHKRNELRNVYNSIVRLNKKSPLYKINLTEHVQCFAIDLKESSRAFRNVLLDTVGEENAAFMQKAAYSSNEELLEADYVGDDPASESEGRAYQIDITQLAAPQINTGDFVASNRLDLKPDQYSFDLTVGDSSYEFQFKVSENHTNLQVQEKLANLINRSNIGLSAQVLKDGNGSSALEIRAVQPGFFEYRGYAFKFTDSSTDKASGSVSLFGLNNVSQPPANAHLKINGEDASSASNTLLIGKNYSVTLKNLTEPGNPVEIGMKRSAATVIKNMNRLANSFNTIHELASNTSSDHIVSNKLLKDLDYITKRFRSTLDSSGLIVQEDGTLKPDESLIVQSMEDGTIEANSEQITHFRNALLRQMEHISLDPMNYINKTMISYPNPIRPFNNPYQISVYSGMIFNGTI
ncbi:MAG: hypothetical protein HFG39_14830 [Lachnospiraceae bacterium]|nr:hypothetical protein [Lachnospiraceae bacterium]